MQSSLYPVQRVVVKLIEGIPLDNTIHFPIPTVSGHVRLVTESTYVQMLCKEGRCNVPPDYQGPRFKRVTLVAGRRSGKGHLLRHLMQQHLLRQLRAPYEGQDTVQFITHRTDDAHLFLRQLEIEIDAANGELAARQANNTRSMIAFQTDADIEAEGPWAGSQRQARASLRVMAHTPYAKGTRGQRFSMLIQEEPEAWLGGAVEDVRLACGPALHGLDIMVGTPCVGGTVLKKRFDSAMHSQDELALQIPTWEMVPDRAPDIFSTYHTADDVTFWAEWGARFVEQKLVVVGATPTPVTPVASGALNDIGRDHQTWQDRNFTNISLLSQGLCLAEECGEVARALVKAHHGIRASDRGNLADELADVILVATSLATRAGIDLDAAVASKAARRNLKDFKARPDSG